MGATIFPPLPPRERGHYGHARLKDIAYDAVTKLWRRRKAAGMTEADLATTIGRNVRWVRHALSCPDGWTLRTFGELVEALDGEAFIRVTPLPLPSP